MKTFTLLFFCLLGLSSCNMKYDTPTLNMADQENILTAHKWKGVEKVRFENEIQKERISITSDIYYFKVNNIFIIQKSNDDFVTGTWQLYNVSGQAVLSIAYRQNNQHLIHKSFEISILTNDYLQLSESDLVNNEHIRTDYFLKK